ncbi:MAG: peptidylprolyl isomerase [Dehalococcoidia bacterium]
MAKQQQKRRRRKYQAGSAYAGDVKPTGILGFLGSALMIRAIFIGMALALGVGGGYAIFAGNLFQGTPTADNFVVPDDNATAEPTSVNDPVEVRQYSSPPPMTIDTARSYLATIRTPLGDIEVELLDDQAPATVNNFVFLAEDGFYDGLTFHQVSAGFAAQAGDPACKADAAASACRGDGGPGYELAPDGTGEVGEGSLSMANGSQFFIALSGSQDFGGYAPFATVVSGLDVAEQLVQGTQIESIDIQEQ